MKKSILIFLFAIVMTIASFAQPPTPTVTNSGDVCESAITFSASPTNGSIYVWEYIGIDGDVTIVYDQYSSSPDVLSSVDGGKIHNVILGRVQYFKSGYGWSAWSNYTSGYNYIEPGAASAPTGASSPAIDVPNVYTTSALDGATLYHWAVYGGDYSGSSTTNSIPLTFYDVYTDYSIEVAGWNAGCGEGYGSPQKNVNTRF